MRWQGKDRVLVGTLWFQRGECKRVCRVLQFQDIMKEIDDKKIISPDLEKKMKDVMTEFDSVFVAE